MDIFAFLTEHIGTTAAIILLIFVRQGIEIGAKLIPDDASGILGIFRKVLKLASGYVPNKSAANL